MKIYHAIFTAFFFLLVPNILLAANLSWEPGFLEGAPGQNFSVSLFLDTQNDSINAVEGMVFVPQDKLVLQNIIDGNSVVNFWVEKPHLQDGKIIFSGIIPGGFKGKRALLFSANFLGSQSGTTGLEILAPKVFLNDGLGTPAQLTFSDALLNIAPALSASGSPASSQFIPIANDILPPEPFSLQISQSPEMFHGRPFLVFATQDKGTGIDHYEVSENHGPFKVASSPYLLESGNINAALAVLAIDRAGNRRMVELQSKEYNYEEGMIIGGVILGVLFLIILSRRKRWFQQK